MSKDASSALFRIIENIAEKQMKNIGFDKEGMVLSTTPAKTCMVVLDGNQYEIKNGVNVTFHQGDKCLVHYINGNSNKKIIIAKL